MKKVYLLVVSMLLSLVGYAATKTVTVSMSREYDDTPLGQWLVDNVWDYDDPDGDANIPPFVFHQSDDNGWGGYDDSNNLYGLGGDLLIRCTEGKIVAVEAKIYDWDDEDKAQAKVHGSWKYKWDEPGVGTVSLNKNDDEMFYWTADNDGYEEIGIAISKNAIWVHEFIITYDIPETPSPGGTPVEVTVKMNREYDDTPLGQWLVDNVWDYDDPDGDAEIPPFVFHQSDDNGWGGYDDSNNLYGLGGDLLIRCTEGKIVAVEAKIYDWDDEDRAQAKVHGSWKYKWDEPGVGTVSLNKNDDEMFYWTADNDGYEEIGIAISKNAIWINELKITYIPAGGGGDDPVVTPPDAPDDIENKLLQSDLTDTFNPDGIEEDITLTRNHDYDVYGFDFNFTGSNSTAPKFVYKTNSDGDTMGEVNVYGGDSFSVTAGQTVNKESVSMTYATFKLTSAAKVTVDNGQVAVNGLNMTWWGDPTKSVKFTVSTPNDACLAFKEVVIYTDKDVFTGGISSGSREYYNIKDGTVTQANVNLYVESSSDFSLTVGAIAPNLGVEIQTITIKVDNKNKMADTKKGQYTCASFEGPFSNQQSIPVEISFIYNGGVCRIPFSVTYPNYIVYKANAPFTFKNSANNVVAKSSLALEVVNPKNLPLTYTVADPTIASVDETGKVTGLKAGETTVTATFAGNATYLEGTSITTVTVGKTEAPITLTASDLSVVATQSATISINNEENLPLTYTSANPEIATVDAQGIVTGVKSGTTSVSIAYAGNDVYNAKTLQLAVTVSKSDAPIVMSTLSYATAVDDNVELVVDNANNLPLTYTSANTAIATVNAEGKVTGIAVGETTVTVSFAGNEVYNPISFTAKVSVEKGNAPLTLDKEDYTIKEGETESLVINNPKNLALKYISGDSKVATVSEDGAITAVGVGTTNIMIAFVGNDTYWGTSLTATVTVLENSGIDSINVDNDEAIYFDLSGQRIYRPAKGAIVIRVEGNKATKMVVR